MKRRSVTGEIFVGRLGGNGRYVPFRVRADRDHAKDCRQDTLAAKTRWRVAENPRTRRDATGGHRGRHAPFVILECAWPGCGGTCVVRESDLAHVVAIYLSEGRDD